MGAPLTGAQVPAAHHINCIFQEHIPGTYSRNRKGLAVQIAANSSLAKGSLCIQRDSLGLKAQQETLIAKKIDCVMQPTGGGPKKGRFK